MASVSCAAHIESVSHLDPSRIPAGSWARLWVTLMEDALSRPMAVPVLVARGRRPGPTLGITAAVHGNEVNGIPVIHKLFEQLDLSTLKGTLVGVPVMNVPGYLNQQRRFTEGADLNKIFPGRPEGPSAQAYAHHFLDRVGHCFDYLIDLHTASFGRANSLYVRADMTDPQVAQMAYLIRPQIIVHKPAADGTLRGSLTERKVPAITVEIGDPLRFQPNFIRTSLIGVKAVLAHLKMLPKRKQPALGPPPVLCERSYWIRTDAGGLLEVHPKLAQPLDAGEPIAQMRDIFGALTAAYHAPEAGVVVGRSVNPIAQTGDRVLHLGVEARADDDRFVRR
ncbi:MAG: succinylglutamate desuccinylase/aspartoacylase family protein [Bradymonadia bacterium]